MAPRNPEQVAFYHSSAWKKSRLSYLESVHYICERCGAPAKVVHHRHYLNEDNLSDPLITLDHSNLEALCQDCHNREHHLNRKVGAGIAFDADGNLVKEPDVFIVNGAPGSGKSSYVREHMKAGDIAFDLDLICSALAESDRIHADHRAVLAVALDMREAFYTAIEHRRGRWQKAWIVTSTSKGSDVDELARRLQADVVTIDATLDECIEHIMRDETRTGKAFHVKLARQWFEDKAREAQAIELNLGDDSR